MDISKLSKKELSENNKKVVLDLLNKNGYNVTQVVRGRDRTSYKIEKENVSQLIKITGYRYNYETTNNYAFVLKHLFDLNKYSDLFFVLYIQTATHILRIPASKFINPAPNSAFQNRDYIGKKSLPEYGIIMNNRTLNELMIYKVN